MIKKIQIIIDKKIQILVLALSVHSVFEGLAIGVEESSADVWKLMAGKLET